MSIPVGLLEALVKQGRLVERGSLFTGDETARRMLVTPEIDAITSPPFPDTVDGERLAEFAAWLDNFLEGGEISVCEDPDDKPWDTMLARVHHIPADFWSIRVTDPENTPGIRALGAFICKDTFVAITWERREDMTIFDNDVADARDAWRDLFGTNEPLHGRNLDAYLSNYRLA